MRKLAIETESFLDETPKDYGSSVIELYGQKRYVRIVGLKKYVEISIRTPPSEDEELNARKLAEKILDALTTRT